MSPSNLKRTISKLLKFKSSDEGEEAIWYKQSLSDDPDYTKGYCLKENNYFSSFDDEFNEKYLDYYTKKKNGQLYNKIGWECKSINKLIPYCKEWCEKNGIQPSYGLRAIVAVLVSEDLIPFSLGRKIRKSDEVFWSVNFEKNCENKAILQHKIEYASYRIQKDDEKL